MTTPTEVRVEDVLAALSDQVAELAREKAMLTAQVKALQTALTAGQNTDD